MSSGAKTAAADSSLPDPTAAKHNYAEALHKTLIFFESMRSGVLDRQRLAWCAPLLVKKYPHMRPRIFTRLWRAHGVRLTGILSR